MKPLTFIHRPRRISEVLGQTHIKRALGFNSPTGLLIDFANTKEFPRAITIHGPYGTGKTTIARILARYINCEHGPLKACLECESCRSMENFTNPDVWEMDAATNNGVDNTVKIKEWAQFNTKRRKKILILDEAHRMSVQAFDALLKIIEEGVENVCFVFCTTEVDKIPDTVLSRTTKFKLFKLTTEETTQLANKICAKEGITIQDPAYFQHLVRKADGHGRDIIQYLNDAATLYSDEPGVITNHSIDLLCELYQSDRVEQFLVGCLNRDLDIMNQIIEESFLEPMGFCKTAIDLLRHEISLRTVLQGQETYKTYKSGDLIRLLGMIEDCKYRLLFGDSLTSLLIGWERWKLGQYIPMTDKEDLKRVI